MTARGERAAGAAGTAVLWVEGGPRLAAGRMVAVTGGLKVGTSGGRSVLTCAVRPEALQPLGYRTSLAAWRAGVVESLRRRLGDLAPEVAATLEALILGIRDEVPEDLYEGFRRAGSLHLLALSGLHAGILYLLVRLMLVFVPLRSIRTLAASVVLLAYLFVAGFRPSLFRAVVMILAAAVGTLLDRDSRPLNLLALAAAVLLLIDPAAVLSLSFQLSFLALAGILLLAPGLQRSLEKVLPPVAAAALSFSLAAQAATAPLLLARFGVVYPVGALAALPLIPLVTVYIWVGLSWLMLSGTFFAGPPAAVLLALHRALRALVELFARAPSLSGGAAAGLLGLLLGALVLLQIDKTFRLRPA